MIQTVSPQRGRLVPVSTSPVYPASADPVMMQPSATILPSTPSPKFANQRGNLPMSANDAAAIMTSGAITPEEKKKAAA